MVYIIITVTAQNVQVDAQGALQCGEQNYLQHPSLRQHGADWRCAPGPTEPPPSLVTIFVRVALSPAPLRTASSGLMGKYPVVRQLLSKVSSY